MSEYEPFIALLISLGVGLLIGIQREQSSTQKQLEDGHYLGGIRTFPLYALAGAIAMLLGQRFSIWFVPVILCVLSAPLLIAYANDVRAGRDRGLTSELAFILTFLLGAMAASTGVIEPDSKKYQVVAAIALTVTGLLSLKDPLHAIVARISKDDLFSTLKFLILVVIILPLLPNRTMGPLDVINPFNIGLMIVLTAAIGFAGYVLIRWLGPGRGMGLTGLIGGLVSSTVVTVSASTRARRTPELANAAILAVLLASSVMLVRVVVLVAAINADLLPLLAAPLGAMFVAGLLCALLFWKKQVKSPSTEQAEFKNPFELGLAIKFGLMFALILLATRAAMVYLSAAGVYLAALLAGTTDLDAITLSTASLSQGGQLDARDAALAILIAAGSNTLTKGVLAVVIGGRVMVRLLLAFVAILAIGFAALYAVWTMQP